MDEKTILTILDNECMWRELTVDTVLDTDSQVGGWAIKTNNQPIWICEFARHSDVKDLIEKYGFTHYRHMNPPTHV